MLGKYDPVFSSFIVAFGSVDAVVAISNKYNL